MPSLQMDNGRSEAESHMASKPEGKWQLSIQLVDKIVIVSSFRQDMR